MNILRLLDPVAPAGGAPTAPATVQPTTTVTTNPMTPREPSDDGFLEDTAPPAETTPAPTPKAGEIVVDGKVVPDPKVTPAPATSVTYTPEQVAELMKRGAAAPTTPAAVTTKPLTPEEIDARLNTFKPSAADLAEIAEGGDKALAAYTRMGAAMVKNAVTVAGIIIQDEVRKLQAWAQPHIDYAQAQQQQVAQQQYFQDNPTHVGLEPLVAQVAEQMAKEKFKGTPAETFKEVGKRVDALVARLKIPVSQPAANGTAPAAPVKPATSRMSTVSTGGQGGAGGAGSGTKDDPEAGIWDK